MVKSIRGKIAVVLLLSWSAIVHFAHWGHTIVLAHYAYEKLRALWPMLLDGLQTVTTLV